MKEKIGLKATWKIFKFKDPDGGIAKQLQAGTKIEDIINQQPEAYIGQETIEGNVALLEGLYLLTGIISGLDTSSPKWDSSNAYIGVGDGTASESNTQTGLQGTNKLYKAMDAGYPQRAANASASPQFVKWRATFGGTEANFAWNEFTVANGSSDAAVNLNRKVTSKGTKSSGETWTLELEIDFS